MKVNVEVDCSPEEMRRFLGLPDISRANDVYVDSVVEAMKGTGNIEQLQDMVKQFAPMGGMAIKFMQQMMESGASSAFGSGRPKKS